ncbi:MAG: hypothetical protein HYW47_02965 [Deltaproteobacteria bacterium]|nr:hypothetical protein [Deltaproteobacteria bacterium]
MNEKVKKRAADFLEGLKKRMAYSVSFELDENNEDTSLVVQATGDDAEELLGKNPLIPEALRNILWRVINKDCEEDEKIRVTIDNSEVRRKFLEKLAFEMRDKALEEDRTIILRPLNSFERRIVHLVLSEDSQVTTKSIGEGSYKKIVISPISNS